MGNVWNSVKMFPLSVEFKKSAALERFSYDLEKWFP